jgi:hypothetical protein
MGVFNPTYGRGLIYDDEAAGYEIMYKNDMLRLPFNWFKGYDGGRGNGNQKYDLDVYAVNPIITVAESWQLNPFLVYLYSKDAREALAAGGAGTNQLGGLLDGGQNTKVVYVGANVDGTIGPVSVFFTGIYQKGTIEDVPNANGDDVDIEAYVVVGGGSMALGPANIHGQAFYASGDGASQPDGDFNGYLGIGGGGVGMAYYWSEIMGLGIMDQAQSAGSPGADLSNIWAANIGASIKPFDKLTITGDVWYAKHVQDDYITNEKNLGTEVDLVLTYQLIEGMNVDLVGAYLFAGDATATDGNNDEDPYEIGSRFSISF